MENIATSRRNLMNPDELLKMDHNKAIVMVRGRKPFICNKYDYSEHSEADKLKDMTVEEQKEKFADNNEQKETNKLHNFEYSFKNF